MHFNGVVSSNLDFVHYWSGLIFVSQERMLFFSIWHYLFLLRQCLSRLFYRLSFVVILWLFVYYRDPQVNWGTSAQANTYRSALSDMLNLLRIEDHVKNYRPQVLVLTGLPCVRPALVYFANSITRDIGLLVCGHVLVVCFLRLLRHKNLIRIHHKNLVSIWNVFQNVSIFFWNFFKDNNPFLKMYVDLMPLFHYLTYFFNFLSI